MADLTESLEVYLDKAHNVVKGVTKISGEKQLVVEVGNSTIKIIEYIIRKDSIKVTGGAVLNTPPNILQNDRITDVTRLANLIKQTLEQEKIKTKEFVVSIVSKDIIIREKNIPPMMGKELKSYIKLNSHDIFPVKLENYVLSYNVLEKGASNKLMIAAVPKDMVQAYIELGKQMGIQLKGINYSGYELYNFLDFEIGVRSKSYLTLDVGAKNTNIVIISDGILKYNKIISKGLEEISKDVAQALSCSVNKAEQLKRQCNSIESSDLDNEEEKVIIECTCDCIDNVLKDLSRIIDFFNSNNPKNKVSQIYITGIIAKIKGVDAYIAKKLNLPVEVLKVFNKVTYDKKVTHLQSKQQNFINCFGAHRLEDRELFVIKEELKLNKLCFVLKKPFNVAACLGLTAILVAIGLNVYEMNNLNVKLDEHNNYLAANKDMLNLRDELYEQQEILLGKQQKLEALNPGMEKYAQVINAVEYAIDRNIITSINDKTRLHTDALVSVIKYGYKGNEITVGLRMELPLGIEEPDPRYYEYVNGVPIELIEALKQTVTADIKQDEKSITYIGASVKEFELKIIMK